MVFMKNVRENWLSDRKRKTSCYECWSGTQGSAGKQESMWRIKGTWREKELKGPHSPTLVSFLCSLPLPTFFIQYEAKLGSCFFLSLKSLLSPLQVSFPCNCLSGASLKGHVTSSSANRVIPGRQTFLCLATSPLVSLHP